MEENKDLELVKELLEKKQYTKLRQMLSDKNTADIAVILEELPEEDLLKIFRILPKTMAADVFSYLEVDHQHEKNHSVCAGTGAGLFLCGFHGRSLHRRSRRQRAGGRG